MIMNKTTANNYLNNNYVFSQILQRNLSFCESNLPYLGCSIRSQNDKPGMEIILVNSESPAWHAGIKIGDILLEIENKVVNNIGDYRAVINSEIVDGGKKTLTFKIMRKREIKLVAVKF